MLHKFPVGTKEQNDLLVLPQGAVTIDGVNTIRVHNGEQSGGGVIGVDKVDIPMPAGYIWELKGQINSNMQVSQIIFFNGFFYIAPTTGSIYYRTNDGENYESFTAPFAFFTEQLNTQGGYRPQLVTTGVTLLFVSRTLSTSSYLTKDGVTWSIFTAGSGNITATDSICAFNTLDVPVEINSLIIGRSINNSTLSRYGMSLSKGYADRINPNISFITQDTVANSNLIKRFVYIGTPAYDHTLVLQNDGDFLKINLYNPYQDILSEIVYLSGKIVSGLVYGCIFFLGNWFIFTATQTIRVNLLDNTYTYLPTTGSFNKILVNDNSLLRIGDWGEVHICHDVGLTWSKIDDLYINRPHYRGVDFGNGMFMVSDLYSNIWISSESVQDN